MATLAGKKNIKAAMKTPISNGVFIKADLGVMPTLSKAKNIRAGDTRHDMPRKTLDSAVSIMAFLAHI